MYDIGDLFDKRSVVGTKLEQFLEERSLTKAKLCETAGISRPTLDKLLAGTLTSKTNFEKHLSKVLTGLSLSPDMLLGNTRNQYNRARALRNIMKMPSAEISKVTGISQERLNEIEAGGQASVAELRDIAYCLSASVRSLSGTNFFGTQIAEMEDCFRMPGKEEPEEMSGFWGHVGILPENQDDYLWFPITGDTHNALYHVMEQDRIVIPCMNNKLLLLNMENIKELVLLDEACDAPWDANWDPGVDCGETPLVLYEAMEDYAAYCEGEEVPDDVLSPFLRGILERFCKQKGCQPEELREVANDSVIRYRDGKSRHTWIDFDYSEMLTEEIANIYNFGEWEGAKNCLAYCDGNESEILLNMRNISLLELPLLEAEEAVCRGWEEE